MKSFGRYKNISFIRPHDIIGSGLVCQLYFSGRIHNILKPGIQFFIFRYHIMKILLITKKLIRGVIPAHKLIPRLFHCRKIKYKAGIGVIMIRNSIPCIRSFYHSGGSLCSQHIFSTLYRTALRYVQFHVILIADRIRNCLGFLAGSRFRSNFDLDLNRSSTIRDPAKEDLISLNFNHFVFNHRTFCRGSFNGGTFTISSSRIVCADNFVCILDIRLCMILMHITPRHIRLYIKLTHLFFACGRHKNKIIVGTQCNLTRT